MSALPKRATPITLRECLFHGALLMLMLLVLFPATFLRGEVAVPGGLLFELNPWAAYAPADFEPTANRTSMEALCAFYQYYILTQRALQNDEWPLWNHLALAGVPLLAAYQAAVFYPPHVLHAFMDVATAMTLYLLLKLWLSGAAAYLCGRTIGLGRAASTFLSLAWMLSAFNMHWCHWDVGDVTPWLPLLFMGVEFILNERYARGFFTVALSGSLLLLAGHPETAFVMGLGVGVYFVLRLALERRRGSRLWRPLAAAAGGWALALGACAAQLLPFLEYLPESYTWVNPHRVLGESSVPFITGRAIVAAWVPRFFGATSDLNLWGFENTDLPSFLGKKNVNSNFVSLIYPGMAVWVAISLSVPLLWRHKPDRLRSACLIVPSILGGLLAFNHPVFQPIHELPLFSSMWRLWHISFAVFAVPLLGAMGVQRWFEGPQTRRHLMGLLPLWLLVLGVIAFSAAMHRPAMQAAGVQSYVLAQVALALLFGLLASLAMAAYVRWPGSRRWQVLVILILVADLLTAARSLRPSVPRDELFVETELLTYLDDVEQPIRTNMDTGPIWPGLAQAYGLETLFGYEGITPNRFQRFLAQYPGEPWATVEPLCAIDHYVYPAGMMNADTERFEHLASCDGFDVLRNRRAFPRAYLVPKLTSLPDSEAVFQQVTRSDIDLRSEAWTEAPVTLEPPGPQGASPGTAHVTQRSSLQVTIGVNATRQSVLVLSDAYFPGWKAEIDESPTDLFPVNYAFRGVIVPPGQHTVRFHYDPLSFRIGMAVSVAALIAGAIAAFVIILRTPRRSRAK